CGAAAPDRALLDLEIDDHVRAPAAGDDAGLRELRDVDPWKSRADRAAYVGAALASVPPRAARPVRGALCRGRPTGCNENRSGRGRSVYEGVESGGSLRSAPAR